MILAGTGHRPDKLKDGFTRASQDKLIAHAEAYLTEQVLITEVVSGCALGWDQALFQAALNLHIPVHAAVPFEGFDLRWSLTQQVVLANMLHRAKRVSYVSSPGYAAWKLQRRNMFMVDNADRIVAFWNGTPGGTANCIAYANSRGKPIDNIWSEDFANA